MSSSDLIALIDGLYPVCISFYCTVLALKVVRRIMIS